MYCDNVRLQSHLYNEAADVTVLISSFRQRKSPPAIRDWMDEYLFRNQGSLALHLAWVAAGLADAAYAAESKLWDIAAGALLIEEAGRTITTETGASLWPIDVSHYKDENLTLLAAADGLHANDRPLLNCIYVFAAVCTIRTRRWQCCLLSREKC